MTTYRIAQRSFDNESPPEPAHDYTEDMAEADYMDWLLIFTHHDDSFADAARDFINARMAAQDKEMRE